MSCIDKFADQQVVKMYSKLLAALSLSALTITDASAHKPSYANNHTAPELAFEVIDPEISIALYAEMTCTAETLWLHMDTTGISEVWLELGVPQLERLEDYKPSLAIVADGLPEAGLDDLPFDVPDGMGATVIDTSDVDEPIDFFEPFTQTDSWILYREWVEVPENTDVYLVAFNPEEITGKLWVAVGLTEDFSDVDASDFAEWMEKTQAFHEVDDDEDHAELDCSLLADDEITVPAAPASPAKTGCSTSGGPSPSVPAIALTIGLLFSGRSRQRLRS